MKIMMVHNFYQQPGGEDTVFAAEMELLRANGHEIFGFTTHNDDIEKMGKLELAAATIWSRSSRCRIAAEIERVQPEIVHFHNTFMLISPSSYYAAKRKGIPVVQTIHNYRLLCPSATLYRDGHVCEECVGKLFPFPAVTHGCYHGQSASAIVATYLAAHRVIGTWSNKIDRYIALTEFARHKLVAAGISADKIAVKSNFLLYDPPIGTRQGNYALFIGRLTPEKGIRTLLKAWTQLDDIPLKIVGDGPLMPEVQAFVAEHGLKQVSVLGYCSSADTMALLQDAYCLVAPSEWYEGFLLTLIEAFASGVPVLASKLGAMAEILEENQTSLFFQAGNAADLAQTVRKAWHTPDEMSRMGKLARAEYMSKYTAQANYNSLIRIYADLLSRTAVDRMHPVVIA